MQKCYILFIALIIFCTEPTTTFGQTDSTQIYIDSSEKYYYTNPHKALEFGWKLESYERRIHSVGSHDYAAAIGFYLGMTYEALGNVDSTELYYIRAIEICKGIKDTLHWEYGDMLVNAGKFYYTQSKLPLARYYLEKSLPVLKNANNTTAYALACNTLADYMVATGEYGEAEKRYTEAMNWIDTRLPNQKESFHARICNSMTMMYKNIGDCEKAMKYSDTAIAYFSKWITKEYAGLLVSRSAILISCRKYKESSEEAKKAIRIYEDRTWFNNEGYTIALNNLALAYQGMKLKSDSTEKLLLNSIEQSKANNGVRSIAYLTFRMNLSSFYDTHGETPKAMAILDEDFETLTQVFGPYSSITLKTSSMKASILIRQKKFDEALQMIRSINGVCDFLLFRNSVGLTEDKKILYRQTMEDSYGLMCALALAMPIGSDFPYAELFQQQLNLKSSIIEQQQLLFKMIQSDTSAAIRKLLNEWSGARKRLVRELFKSNGKRDKVTDSLDAIIGLAYRKMSFKYPDLNDDNKKLYFDSICSRLKKGEVAIEFIQFNMSRTVNDDEVSYAAFLLKPGMKQPLFISLFRENQLKKLLYKNGKRLSHDAFIRTFYSDTDPVNVLKLYNLIWRKLEKHIGKSLTVYYSPTGVLNNISFAAIPLAKDRFLFDKYNLRCLLNLREILSDHLNKENTFGKLSLWGDFDYGAGLYKRLPRGEIDSIIALYHRYNKPISFDKGAEATEEAFKEKMNRNTGDIHIRTHGFFSHPSLISDEPIIRSGLLFAEGNKALKRKMLPGAEDGILTAYEIDHPLDLRNINLVTLSACETGLVDIKGNEGVFGLQRSFFKLGVKKMLISLWEVPQLETSELMILFYKKRFLKGITEYEAFHQAQLELRSRKTGAYYWAGFVLIE